MGVIRKILAEELLNGQQMYVHLRAIKDKFGTIAPHWFMSDNVEQYFNAWQGVFGGSDTCKVICVWRVHRVWRKAIKEHIVLKEDQVIIYHLLCTLIMECEEATFRTLLREF